MSLPGLLAAVMSSVQANPAAFIDALQSATASRDAPARHVAPAMRTAPIQAPAVADPVAGATHRWEFVTWNLQHVSVAEDQTIYAIEKGTNRIMGRPRHQFHWSDLAKPPEPLKQLAAVNSSRLFAVSQAGNLWHFANDSWYPFPGTAKHISASMDGNLWCVTPEGVIMQWMREPRRWQERGSHATSVCVAAKNIVWMVDVFSQPHWWDGCNWEALPPMFFKHVSVAESGCAVGLTAAGVLYHWTGREWIHAASGFIDASMCNGRIIVVDKENRCLCLHKVFKLHKAPSTSHPATVLMQSMAAFQAPRMEARPSAGYFPAATAHIPNGQAVAPPSSPPLARPMLNSSAEQASQAGLLAEFAQIRTSVAAWSPEKYKAIASIAPTASVIPPSVPPFQAPLSTPPVPITAESRSTSASEYFAQSMGSARVDPRMSATDASNGSLGSTVSLSGHDVQLHSLIPDGPIERDLSMEAAPYRSPLTYLEDWITLRGGALQSIALSTRGSILGFSSSNRIHARQTDGSWALILEKQLCTMDCLDSRNIVGTDKCNRLWQCRNGEWRMLPGRGTCMALGEDGSIWSINMSGALQRWDSVMRRWRVELQGVVNVSAANNEVVWCTTKDMQVLTRQDGKWIVIPGLLTTVACSANGSVYGINAASQAVQWDGAGSGWKDLGMVGIEIRARGNHLAVLDRRGAVRMLVPPVEGLTG